MINSTNVCIDLDGVVADFEKSFCGKFGNNGRHIVKLEDRYPDKKYEIGWFVDSCKTYSNLDVIDLGVKIVRFCENSGFELHYVSSRPDNTINTTLSWLNQNKIPFHCVSVGHLMKHIVIERTKPLFVVDDMLSVVDACAEVGIPSFLIDHPWNQKDDLDGIIHRIKTFDDFLYRFEKYFDI